MKLRKLVTSSAVCVALAGTAGVANAAIPGIPGEALFVPVVMTGGTNVGNGNVETFIGLSVPAQIGQDQLINVYSAPHTTGGGPWPKNQVIDDPRIWWTLYDANSKKVDDGFCEISENDYVVWTTDNRLKGIQQLQQDNVSASGKPASLCGTDARIAAGYVLFQTVSGADGEDADFAFAGEATVWNGFLDVLLSPPVMPMADGADVSATQDPTLYNEVVAALGFGDGTPLAQDPSRFAPVLSGIRMNNADGVTRLFKTQMTISGPASGNQRSMHVHWFSTNNENRVPSVIIWDDQEGQCSTTLPLKRELNITMYNETCTRAPGFGTTTPNSWLALGEANCARVAPAPGVPMRAMSYTDLLYPSEFQQLIGLSSKPMCNPTYWLPVGGNNYPGALGGFALYQFFEEGEPAPAGFVNRASVQFQAIEVQYNGTPWGQAMAIDLGKM